MLLQKIKGEINVSLVIPVYNSADILVKNLPKILDAKKNQRNKILEILVIDDASPDNTANIIRKKFPNVRVIKHSVSRGFSASVNTGARASKGKLVLCLSCDLTPLNKFLAPAVGDFEDPRVFSVFLQERGYTLKKSHFKDGLISHEWGKLGDKDKPNETFWVSSRCALYRRDYWMKLGGVDEKLFYPQYWEDFDLSYRAAKRGFVNIFDPRAQVVSSESVKTVEIDSKKLQYVYERNRLFFHWKNITSSNLFRRHFFGLIKKVLKSPNYLVVILMALRKLRIVLKARRKELKETKIADEAILAKFKND